MKLKTFEITSGAGVNLGTYAAKSPKAALDAMARDAGYESQAHAEKATGEAFGGKVAEVVLDAEARRAILLAARRRG
jgi:hypothetical protein